jgi:hypothetical protein
MSVTTNKVNQLSEEETQTLNSSFLKITCLLSRPGEIEDITKGRRHLAIRHKDI